MATISEQFRQIAGLKTSKRGTPSIERAKLETEPQPERANMPEPKAPAKAEKKAAAPRKRAAAKRATTKKAAKKTAAKKA